jgi:DNA-directed RNA polymerase specialized sigma24 family protein
MNSKSINEKINVLECIKKSLEGDESASAALIKKYDRALSGHIKSKVGNIEEVDDIKQSIWEDVFKNLEKYNPGRASFYTWLRRFKVPSALTQHYKEKKRNPENFSNSESIQNADKSLPMEMLIQQSQELFSGEKFEDPLTRSEALIFAHHQIKFELLEGGPPNEIITHWCCKRMPEFGFNKGIPKFTDKYLNVPFGQIIQDIRKYFMRYFCMEDSPDYFKKEEIEKILTSLERNFKKPVRELISPYTPIKKTGFPDELLNSPAEVTTLLDYLKQSKRASEMNISGWIYKVKRRVKSKLSEYIRVNYYKKGDEQ